MTWSWEIGESHHHRLMNFIDKPWFFLLPHYILHRSSPGQILGFGGWQPIVRMIRIHMVKSKGLLSKSVFYFHFKKLDTSLTKCKNTGMGKWVFLCGWIKPVFWEIWRQKLIYAVKTLLWVRTVIGEVDKIDHHCNGYFTPPKHKTQLTRKLANIKKSTKALT